MRKKNKTMSAAKKSATRRNVKKSSKKSISTNIKEHCLKTSPPKCKATFRLSKKEVRGAKEVTIVGDFNNWNITEIPMKKLKNGDFEVTIELLCNKEYKFGYLINPERLLDDWDANECVNKSYICED